MNYAWKGWARAADRCRHVPAAVPDELHHQHLMRELGLLSINRVTAAKAGARKPRRNDRRVDKNVHIEDKTVTLADGTTRTVRLYASGGALGIAELDDTGTQHFVPIAR